MHDEQLEFRFLRRLPVNVVGPSTRWIVMIGFSGKGGKLAEVYAKCLTNGKSVLLLSGREEVVQRWIYGVGFAVKAGTVQAKLMIAATAQGNAERIAPSSARSML